VKIYLPFIFETLQKPWFSDETRYLGHLETIEWGCFLYESGDGIIKKEGISHFCRGRIGRMG
jgi:hypothetical protein